MFIKPRFPHKFLRTVCLAVWAMLLAPQTAHAAERLVICYGAASAALVPLAKLRDFYAAEGLDVELRHFPSGRQALEAMFAGKCSLATVAETPVAHYSLSRNDFRILAAISVASNFERIIAHSDRGILTPADLRGRRIAVSQFTTAHYFLDTWLAANGLLPHDVKIIYLPAQEIAPAFRRGDVDAVAHWEPTIQMLASEFGARAKIFSASGLHISPYLLVGGRDYVRNNSVTIERVLRALLRAEHFAKEQSANAKALIAQDYAAAPSEIELIWPMHDFRVALEQTLPFILENAARWDIGLMPPAQRPVLPNYLDFIYLDGLKTVKPEAVTIIH